MLTVLILALGLQSSAVVKGPHCVATLETDVAEVAPGQEFRVAISFKMDPGWHIYWINPGDSGMATSVKWNGGTSVTFGPIRWPEPIRFEGAGGVSFGYKGEVRLISTAKAGSSVKPGSLLRIEADVSWLVCEEACIAGGGKVATTLKVVGSARGTNRERAAAFDKSLRTVPKPLAGATAKRTSTGFELVLRLSGQSGVSAFFFPASPETISHSDPQVARWGEGLTLSLVKSEFASREPKTLDGVVVVKYENNKSSAYQISAPIRD